jgi:ubiquinone/menaquinone biosynthesis C-methylase UbiE
MERDPYHGRSTETTAYFADLTDLYERYRPAYPQEAIAAIVQGLPSDAVIADVGCGTSISSRQLAATGCQVIGIEPDEAMRRTAESAAALSPHADLMRFQHGTGELTKLDVESVDAVVCAQSFHWFDADAALAEFARILKPNGLLALMWNKVSRDDEFSAGYRAIMREAGAIARQRGRSLRLNNGTALFNSRHFANVRDLRFANVQMLDLDGVLGRARSASYFPVKGPQRQHLEQELRNLFTLHATDGEREVSLCYETQLILAERC